MVELLDYQSLPTPSSALFWLVVFSLAVYSFCVGNVKGQFQTGQKNATHRERFDISRSWTLDEGSIPSVCSEEAWAKVCSREWNSGIVLPL